MKRKIFLVLYLFCHAYLYSQESQRNSMREIPEHQTKELIVDRRFKRGFSNNLNGLVLGCPTADPVWNVAEWNSKFSVFNQQPDTNTGMCRYASNYKDFRFGGPVDAKDYDLYLGVNSDAEFLSHFRSPSIVQNWPAIFVEQQLSPTTIKQIEGPGSPFLSMLKALNFKIDAKLLYNQTIYTQTIADSTANHPQHYNSQLHAAQFLVYFTLQNLNINSTHYGQIMWLGLTVYDDRYRFVPGSDNIMWDTGTNTFMYNIASSDFSSQSSHDGNWVFINIDLLPFAKKALKKVWDFDTDRKVLGSTNLADYKIGGINIGWETTGRNISTVIVKNVSLVAKTDQLFWGLERVSNNAKEEASVSVFPNPSVNSFVTFSGKQMQAISIINYLGQEVIHMDNLASQGEEVNVDISHLSNGIYYSVVKTENGMEQIKFFKQ